MFGILVGAYSCNFLAPSLFLWISGKQVASGKSGMQNLPDSKESEVAQNPVAVSDNTTEVIPTAQRKLRGKRQDKK